VWVFARHGGMLLCLLCSAGDLLHASEGGGDGDADECGRRVWLLQAVLLHLVLLVHRGSL